MPKRIPLEGRIINKLTVLEYNYSEEKYLCKCECGNKTLISYGCLKNNQKSCGCAQKEAMDSKREKLEGKKLGRYLVLTYLGKKENKNQYYLCRCECGTEKEIAKNSLTSGAVKSCGCYNKELAAAKCKASRIKLEGKKFSRLTVIKYNEDEIHSYECKCDCGKITTVRGAFLRSGHTTSCGCFHREITLAHLKVQRDFARETFVNNLTYMDSAAKVWKNYSRDTDLTFEEFFELSQKNCHYCGVGPSKTYNYAKYKVNKKPDTVFPQELSFYNFKYNGLDRVDNNIDHRKSNVVTCCWQCNNFKSNRTVEKFLVHVKRIINNGFLDKEIKLIGGGDNIKLIKEAKVKEYWKKHYADGDISIEKFLELSGGDCFYCGNKPSCIRPCRKGIELRYNGLDRIDNSRGHYLDNVIVCCGECNLRRCRQSFGEFRDWLNRFRTL